MSATAFPLSWPPGFPRATRRENGQFNAALDTALRERGGGA